MPLIANLLHISDTHFSTSLTEDGRRLKRLKLLPGPNTHAFSKVDSLAIKVRHLAREKGNIDLFLITGDVTTDGSIESLKTAVEFFEEHEGIYRGTPPSLRTLGLGAKRQNRIVVPGNHDRYAGAYSWPPRQQPSDDLETVFGVNENYPYAVAFRDATVSPSQPKPALIFFVFDTTLADDGNRDSFLERIAMGRFEISQGEWLREASAKISKTGQVRDLSGTDLTVEYEKCVRIAVLHHHPVQMNRKPDETDVSILANSIDFTTMENSSHFVEACFDAGIDFIMFGHQHLKYDGILNPRPRSGWTPPRRAHSIRFFCCPSTTEFRTHDSEAKKNGFYFFSFADARFDVETYAWQKELRTFEKIATFSEQYPRFAGGVRDTTQAASG